MSLWSWLTGMGSPAVERRPAAVNLGQVMTWFLQGSQAALEVAGARPEEGPGRIGWHRRGPYIDSAGEVIEISDALANYIPRDDLAGLVIETALEALAVGYVDFRGNPHAMRRLPHGVLTIQQAAFWAGAEETAHAIWIKRTYSLEELIALEETLDEADLPAVQEAMERGIDVWMVEIGQHSVIHHAAGW